MAELDSVPRGTKYFQVPEYFNFADVIDEWAQKEKVKTVKLQIENVPQITLSDAKLTSFSKRTCSGY